jgi:tyrosyl-tRNA synthetase
MGGSDQWGNITAGIELIRKLRGKKAHGHVWPLMTTSSGGKFGKTEAGTIWLDPQRTSPYRFYQFWLNTDDKDVVKYLKLFTWMGREEIGALEAAVADAPQKREAQRTLAREVTRAVHGDSDLAQAERASQVLFGGSLAEASLDDILTVFDDVPSIDLPKSSLESGMGLTELVVASGLASSKGEAARLVKQGGLYINDARASDERARVTLSDALAAQIIVLRKGARERRLVRVS